MDVYMLHHMPAGSKKFLVELDGPTAARLEAVASGRTRSRSAFVRDAIRRALDAVAEQKMKEAYQLTPDDEPTYFDAAAWEPAPRPRKRRRA
jgi:Arc/MetJ-type ribon-helix-helix transcriptional regulator